MDLQSCQKIETWNLTPGNDYFVTRNGSSIIAFSIPESVVLQNGFRIIASHSDSPSFKIKENPEMAVEDHYIKLNVERYGGMLCAPWFDRPLSVAGRVIVKENGTYCAKLINADRDLPSDPESCHSYEPGCQQRIRL